MKLVKTIELNSTTTEVVENFILQSKVIGEEMDKLKKEFADKAELIKTINSKLEGILTGIVTNEGVDLKTHSATVSNDRKQVLIYELPKESSGDTKEVKPKTKKVKM